MLRWQCESTRHPGHRVCSLDPPLFPTLAPLSCSVDAEGVGGGGGGGEGGGGEGERGGGAFFSSSFIFPLSSLLSLSLSKKVLAFHFFFISLLLAPESLFLPLPISQWSFPVSASSVHTLWRNINNEVLGMGWDHAKPECSLSRWNEVNKPYFNPLHN